MRTRVDGAIIIAGSRRSRLARYRELRGADGFGPMLSRIAPTGSVRRLRLSTGPSRCCWRMRSGTRSDPQRSAQPRVSRSLHPESDWLWVWAEMGLPSIALLLGAGVILFWRVLPLKEGTNQRVRFTAAAGALLFALHGCVDVSAHRLGTFLAGTLFLGLAQFCPGPAGSQKRWPAFGGLIFAVVASVVPVLQKRFHRSVGES